MPLPLIPVLLGGAALASAAFGAKKGYDAYNDSQEAKEYGERSERLSGKIQTKLDSARRSTNATLEELGRLQMDIVNGTIDRAVKLISKLKIERSSLSNRGQVQYGEIGKFVTNVHNFRIAIDGMLASAGGGALAGFGAFGAVGSLATASTGTAIGGLSGVAATNATLAWFGGGSLAAGGLGMAGGMAVLGGVVAGPAIAIGGWFMASIAEEKKEKARSLYRLVQTWDEYADGEIECLEHIRNRCNEKREALKELDKKLDENLEMMYAMFEEYNFSLRAFPNPDKALELVDTAIYQPAQAINKLIDAPILSKDDEITQELQKHQNDGQQIIKKITEKIKELQ